MGTITAVTIANSDSIETLNISIKKKEELRKKEELQVQVFKNNSEPSPLDHLRNLLIDKPSSQDSKGIFSNWQMSLTSIIKNIKQNNDKKGLEQLWLIGSKDMDYGDPKNPKDGSAKQLKDLVKILFFFFKDKFDIYVYDMQNNTPIKLDLKNVDKSLNDDIIKQIGLDFDNFDQIYKNFKKIIHTIKKISKKSGEEIEERRIAIDITGGQKPISVAGAIATLRFKTRIVYVNTNNLPAMKEIDAKIETEPEL